MGFGIAVGLTAAAVILTIGTIAFRAAGRPWRVPLIAILCTLPLHAVSLYFVRLPLHAWLTTQLSPDVLFWVSSLYAPLLEEPPKWLVLGGLFAAGQVTTRNAVGVALAIGVGFGLGEIGTLAASIFLHQPEQTGYPFYFYSGFFIERLLVCFLHGAFVVPVAVAFVHRRHLALAAPAGIALHYLVNLPLMLATMNAFGLSHDVWIGLAMPWLVVMTVILAGYVGLQLRRAGQGSLLGDAVCQVCNSVFPHSFAAINLGPWKLQRCPHCGRWQLV